MAAIGVSTYRYKLVAFVIAGMGAGLAGALMANLQRFVSPDMLAWTKSGELMIMVILGGALAHRADLGRDRPGGDGDGARRLDRALAVLARPHPRVHRAVRARRPVRLRRVAAEAGRAMTGPMLRLEGLVKRFGASSPPTT